MHYNLLEGYINQTNPLIINMQEMYLIRHLNITKKYKGNMMIKHSICKTRLNKNNGMLGSRRNCCFIDQYLALKKENLLGKLHEYLFNIY